MATEHAIVQPYANSEKSYMFKIAYKGAAPKVALTGDIMPVIVSEEEPIPKSLILQVW